MTDFQRLLDQAAAPVTPAVGADAGPVLNNPFLQKQLEVTQASAEKKAALSPTAGIPDFYQMAAGQGNQLGAQSMSPLETDLRSMQPLDLYLKYGSSAVDLLNNQAAGGTAYFNDTLQQNNRTAPEIVTDTVSGVGSGFAGSLGGLAALGTGLIDAEAGTSVASTVQDGMRWIEDQQSGGVNAARRVQRAQSSLDFRDNALQRENEISDGSSEIAADLRRWGRDTVETLGNSLDNPTMLAQGTAEAGGSLLAGGPISKGLKVIGGATLKSMGIANAGRLGAAAEFARWPLVTAGLEAGGAYSQTSTDILSMPFDQLEANSPTYRELINTGVSPEQARIEVANKSALFAAAIQAPIAATAGTLTRFAERPFNVPSVGSAIGNTLIKEPLEEAIQSTTSGVAQNLAVQKYADTSRNLSEGVGEQTAQGALFGATSAGAVQAPGVAVQVPVATAKLVYRGAKAAVQPLIDKGVPLFNALVQRGAERIRNMEKASPVADEVIQERAAANVAAAPITNSTINEAIQSTDATPEDKTQSQEYVSTLTQAMTYDPNSEEFSIMAPDQKAILDGSASRPEAIQRMAREVARLEGPEQLRAAAGLYLLMEPFYNLQESDPTAIDSVAMSNPQINQTLQQYEAVIADIQNTPSVQRALRAINEMVSKNQIESNIQPVTEESLGTVEGQQNVRNALAVSSLHPDRGNLQANEQILTHAANGVLSLTPQQQATLKASVQLLRARQTLEAEIKAKGLRSAKDVVSEQVVAGNDPLRKITLSALGHTQGILSAMRGKNTDLAAARLEDFGKFVRHMQNKVNALNEHFVTGNYASPPVKYEALQPNINRDFKQSRDGMYVNTRSPKSIDQAQSIALEARILSDVYNGLTETFPDLAQAKIELVSLVPDLQGNPDELAQKFRTPVQKKQEEPQEQESLETSEVEIIELETETKEIETQPELIEEKDTDQTEDEEIPLSLTVEKIEDDSNRYAFSFGGKDVGYIDISDEGQVQASNVKKEYRGMGIGKSMYIAVADKLLARGKTLSSDGSVTAEAGRVWESLGRTYNVVKNPTAFQKKDGHWFTEDGESVFTLSGKKAVDFKIEDTTPVVSTEQVVDENQTPVPTGIEAAYPNLYKGVRNLFLESFQFPQEPKTNIYAEESPASTIRRVLASNLRLQSFVTGAPRNTLSMEAAEAYQALLSDKTEGNTLGHLLSNVETNLQEFLKTKGKKFGQDGVEANRWRNGKVLNLVEQVDSGFNYNTQIMEQAGLAAMQWLLSANQYESNMDEQDVSELTGIPVYELTPEIIERVTQGMSMDQAVRSLGQKISNYWGLNGNREADIAYVEGIPQAMASEMIRGLRDMGLLNIETTEISKDDFSVQENRTIQRYIAARLDENDPIRTFQDAIETAVMVSPEHTNYFGDEKVPVAKRQMNNPEVQNTPAQKDALEKEQQTPFYINRPMVSFFTTMGRENLLSLFGTVIKDPEEWNVNHLSSLEGQNQSITSAYNHMLDVAYDLTNFAETASKNIDEVPVRYGYNMSRVGRMQMLGKYNPQASKLVREAFMPTRVTVDLSNQNNDIWDAYTLGLAQAMGVKVHNMPIDLSQNQLTTMLNGGLAPVIEMLQEWLKNADLNDPLSNQETFTSEQVDLIRSGFKKAGADLTMASLHGVVDYARLQNTDDKSKFTTSIYLEADGVTNGPINAMALMTIGEFQEDWLNNIRKGGLTIGDAQTMAEIRQNDPKDLYQASTDATRANLSLLRNQLAEQSNANEALEQLNQLLSMIDLFSSDVTFNPDRAWEDGALEMKRGIAKNPLTITVYGSGAAGIAGKLVSQLTTEIYARMSAVVQARAENPKITLPEAMFPNDPDAQIKMDRFQAAYNALTRQKPFWSKGELVFENVGQRRTSFDPRNFTFQQSELEAMNANMLQLFVEPMRQGIEDTVGSRLMKAVSILRDSAQIQSIILENQFVQAIDQALTDKEANDPNWKRGEFLSRVEIEKIQRKLQTIAPLVQTGDQSFMIASNQRLEVRGNDLEISAALDDTMRASPSIYAPGQAGVRAIPMLTIGMGDGMMMQLLAQAGLQGTLKIFDGMNMPLDKIKDYSLQANEAVYESWKGNPLKEMSKTFDRFMKNFKDDFINDQTYDSLTRLLFTPQERNERAKSKDEKFSVEEIRDRIEGMQANLQWSAESIDARHEALQSMPVSVDQMAAAGTPYQNGRSTLNLTTEQALAELNKRYNAIMDRSSVDTEEVSIAPVQINPPEESTPEMEKVGRFHSTGVRVLSWTAMTNLARMNTMTEAQKTIFDEIRRSLAAKEYKVIAGSLDQLDAYIEQKGLNPRPDQEVFGWINIGDNTIYMVNPTIETMVHELVHASSYQTALAYYNREDLGPNAKEITDAMTRLESMMEDFLELNDSSSAYASAREAILSANLESDQAVAQAKAINEFMAWALTNEQLTDALKKKQVPRLVQMAKDVIKAIKQMIWGRKVAPKSADDFLSNLQFNAGIIIRSQPTISTINRDGELFHSAAYGTNDRLKEVRTAFGKKIIDYLGDEKFTLKDKLRQVRVSDAQMAAIDVALSMNAHGFPMTMQESATFRMIVSALATEAQIDPNALSRAQELYAYVSKKLTVEDFMEDPESLDPGARYYAQEKYDSVMGKNVTRMDDKGRSTLLPAFLGLATVSDEFRAVLAKMGVPQKEKNAAGTLDAMLENTSNRIMDSLSNRLAGDTSSKNVQQSVDNLIQHIKKVAQDEQTFLDQYASKAGGIMDRVNDYVVDGMEKLSDMAMEKATEVEKNAKNAITRNTARMTKLLASVVSEKNGAIVAEQTMVMLNKSNLWEPMQKLMADLVGRTQSNALVYDMIKVTRSMVQQVRQQFREETPRIIMSKFTTKLSSEQTASMFNAIGKTDLAVLRDSMSHADIQKLFSDQTALDNEINKLEQLIQANDKNHFGLIKTKMQQLAVFMNTGVPGKNLLRNAYSVANLYGQTVSRGYKTPPSNIIKAIDKLVTLYAVESLSKTDRTNLASLVQSEADGLSFTLDYLVGQRKEEISKAAKDKARINAYKGFIPTEQEQGVSLVVQNDSDFAELRQKGYVRVADYKGSSTERRLSSRGYYYAPLSGRAIFNQGIMQNVRHTAGGVDSVTGFTVSQMAGRVTDRTEVRRLSSQMRNETNNEEALMPIYDEYGTVVALERPMSAVQWQRVQPSQNLPRMIGVWRGRQAEEGMSRIYNEKLIDSLYSIYEEDMKVSSSNQKQYVNLLSPRSLNRVQQDAVNLFTDETLEYIREKFGEQFWVRKDMLDDAIGYRSASVGDFWTGDSKWSKETQDTVKNLVAAFSLDGYKYLVKGEQVVQNLMADARTLIVVKSVVVPVLNFMSNIYYLMSVGTPLLSIVRSMPKKLTEIDSYAKTRLRQIDAEAELRATENPIEQRKLKAEIQSITDSHKRLSIWPLIEAGEFSTIADVGMTNEDLELTSGKLVQYMEGMINKLPEKVRNAGRYALITRDTALFQGLQKSVQYGDFIAKAVLYDDLVKRQKKSKTYAMGRVTEEFVNYDRLPGRFRSYLENMGLLWFYNYKIRISKVALSMIRNNPVHALMTLMMPMPIDGVDSVLEDNIVAKAIDGSMGWSMGPGMAIRAPTLNPWWNLVN